MVLLGSLEPPRFEDLNTETFGVFVIDRSGSRRELLLPDPENIETVKRQVGVAARKAGIQPGEPFKLYRLRTRRFSKPA